MSTEENKALIRRYYDLFTQGNIKALKELMDPELVCYVGGYPEPIRGVEAAVELEMEHREAFSDIRYTLLDIIAEGDKVSARRGWSMKHTGEFEGVRPTGKRVTGTAIDFFRIRNGRIVEMWVESDNLSFMQNLGAIPVTENAERSGL